MEGGEEGGKEVVLRVVRGADYQDDVEGGEDGEVGAEAGGWGVGRKGGEGEGRGGEDREGGGEVAGALGDDAGEVEN